MLELRHQGEAVPVRMRLSRLRLDVLPGSVGEEGVDLEPGLEPAIVLGKIWYSHVQSVHRKALWALKCGETKQHIINILRTNEFRVFVAADLCTGVLGLRSFTSVTGTAVDATKTHLWSNDCPAYNSVRTSLPA